jgi:hypothetical protein
MKNFKLIFLEGWKNGYWIFAFVAFLFDIVIPEDWVSFQQKVIILVVALTIAFILKIIIQLIEFRELDFNFLGYNLGSGIYEGIELVKIEKDSKLHIDLMLVLYDNSTSISSPVALIKVVDIDHNYALGLKLFPVDKSLSDIISRKEEKNFKLKSKINNSVFIQLTS